MANRPTELPNPQTVVPFFNWGSEQTSTALALQKELLDAYEEANRNWLARVKTEVDLWSDLAATLSKAHSVPEALEAYAKSASQRMQMAAEDGNRMVNDSQKIAEVITRSLGNAGASGGH